MAGWFAGGRLSGFSRRAKFRFEGGGKATGKTKNQEGMKPNSKHFFASPRLRVKSFFPKLRCSRVNKNEAF
jgi:hypothetical protein